MHKKRKRSKVCKIVILMLLSSSKWPNRGTTLAETDREKIEAEWYFPRSGNIQKGILLIVGRIC